MERMRVPRYGAAILCVLIGAVALANVVVWRTPTAARKGRPYNRHAVDELASKHVGEAPRVDREHSAGIEQERYDNRAFPADQISSIRREEGAQRVRSGLSTRARQAARMGGSRAVHATRRRRGDVYRTRNRELGTRDIAGHLAALRET